MMTTTSAWVFERQREKKDAHEIAENAYIIFTGE